jgi:hypothetical protein
MTTPNDILKIISVEGDFELSPQLKFYCTLMPEEEFPYHLDDLKIYQDFTISKKGGLCIPTLYHEYPCLVEALEQESLSVASWVQFLEKSFCCCCFYRVFEYCSFI